MCGDKVWLSPPSCSLSRGGVVGTPFSTRDEKELKWGKARVDRAGFSLQNSTGQVIIPRGTRKFPIAFQAHLRVSPAGGSMVLWSEQRPPAGLERGELQIISGTPGRPGISDTGAATWLPLSVP